MKLTRYGTRSMLTRRSEARQRRETVRRKADRGDRFGTQIDPTRNENDRERRAPIHFGSARVFRLDLLLDARVDRSPEFLPRTITRAAWIGLWQGCVATI